MKKKIISKEVRNYFIYFLVVLFTISLVIYLRSWYRSYLAYQLTIPVIDGYLHEIKYNELDNYILENPDFVLYMCTSNDKECRDYEREFRKIVRKYNLKDRIIYLNLTDHIKNKDNTLLNINLDISSMMNEELFFHSYPSISIFKEKKLHDLIIVNNSSTLDEVVQFLEEYEIIMKY